MSRCSGTRSRLRREITGVFHKSKYSIITCIVSSEVIQHYEICQVTQDTVFSSFIFLFCFSTRSLISVLIAVQPCLVDTPMDGPLIVYVMVISMLTTDTLFCTCVGKTDLSNIACTLL